MVLNERAQRPRPIELSQKSGDQMLYIVPGHKELPAGHESIKLSVELGSELGPQQSFGAEACKAEGRCVAPLHICTICGYMPAKHFHLG